MERPHSHPGMCWGKYEVSAWYRHPSLRVANAASRRREGRLRTPVVYKAGVRAAPTPRRLATNLTALGGASHKQSAGARPRAG